MPHVSKAYRFLILALVLNVQAAQAEGLSTYASIAFQDFTVWQCSRNEPTRAAEFAKLRQPPHTCATLPPEVMEQARKSVEYQAMHNRLAREMGPLSKQRLTDFCQAALDARC